MSDQREIYERDREDPVSYTHLGAVLFDSLAAAKARGVDVVLCDTAGRLHNKVNLMNELSKLRKIIDRETPDVAKETLLVLDATTGPVSYTHLRGAANGHRAQRREHRTRGGGTQKPV